MRAVVRKRILNKYNSKCCICGSKDNLEIDHIVPLSVGGRHDEDNMQVLCRKCNRGKSNKIPYERFIRLTKEGDVLVNQDMFLNPNLDKSRVFGFIEKLANDPDKYYHIYKATGKEDIKFCVK
jgi:hypothetical protein